jgi:hypothetical protein
VSRHPDGFPTLTLRGGGWIIVAFALVLGGFLAWAVSGIFVGERPVGGGSDPALYGFRLEPLAAVVDLHEPFDRIRAAIEEAQRH